MNETGKKRFELARVIERFEDGLHAAHPQTDIHGSVLSDIRCCRTSVMGGHREVCNECGHERFRYNSCGNRHCPKCQNTEREMWMRNIGKRLPKCKFFHVVFTLPEELNPLFLRRRVQMQDCLFAAARHTVKKFAADEKYLGGQSGMIAVLHTRGQTLCLHPHLHCMVPQMGLNKNNKAIKAKKADNKNAFLFPVRQMSVVFAGKFLSDMSAMLKKEGLPIHTTGRKAFNVHAKLPFKGVESVAACLGRYTHKAAIGNHRIKDMTEGHVAFGYKDHRDHKIKEMTLDGVEFLRRFCMHIQPRGYRKIRSYGVLAPSNRKKLNLIRVSLKQTEAGKREKISAIELAETIWNMDLSLCPKCGKGKMSVVETLGGSYKKRPPPKESKIKTTHV